MGTTTLPEGSDTHGKSTSLVESKALADCSTRGRLDKNHIAYLTWEDMARETEDVVWLWDYWLPMGMLTLLVGEPGIGKSALALGLVSSVIRSDRLPDGALIQAAGKVVWVETEAGQQINLGRAKAWRLPLDKIMIASTNNVFPDGHLDKGSTLASLQQAASQEGVRLVVVDSLRGAHRGDENSSNIVDLMAKLASLARDRHIAVLVVHHVRKQQIQDDDDRISLDRVRGSSAILQTPRVVWAVDQPGSSGNDLVRLYQIKNNLARFPHALGFQITDEGLKYGLAPEAPRCLGPREVAKEFLLRLLAGGPVRSLEVTSKSGAEGIHESTLNRAKTELGIKPKRDKEGWWWVLPDSSSESAI
jgi:hypothetical protein